MFGFIQTANQSPQASGGNAIIDTGNYRVHRFTGTGTFTWTKGVKTLEYIVLAGGGSAGGGSYQGGGGGGAGGLIESSFAVAPRSYTMIVGGATGPSSIQDVVSATAGGRGADWWTCNAGNGGSGGGDGGQGGCCAGSGTAGQGNGGGCGRTASTYDPGGGGGGKGGGGGGAGGETGGGGGAGYTSSFDGTSRTYARGGGGRANNSGGAANQGYGASYGGTGAGSGVVMVRYLR